MSITVRFDCDHCRNIAEVDGVTLEECQRLLRNMGWSTWRNSEWRDDVRCPECYRKWDEEHSGTEAFTFSSISNPKRVFTIDDVKGVMEPEEAGP